MRYDQPRLVWTSLTTTRVNARERERGVKGGWREEGERGEVCQ